MITLSNKNLLVAFLSLLFFLSVSSSYAAKSESQKNNIHTEESVNPGEIIFHHIYDAYEWHICTIGETHVSIPLLAIVYSEKNGWNVFSTSYFHHGEKLYKGFKIARKGEENEGKIVEKQADGTFVKMEGSSKNPHAHD